MIKKDMIEIKKKERKKGKETKRERRFGRKIILRIER